MTNAQKKLKKLGYELDYVATQDFPFESYTTRYGTLDITIKDIYKYRLEKGKDTACLISKEELKIMLERIEEMEKNIFE